MPDPTLTDAVKEAFARHKIDEIKYEAFEFSRSLTQKLYYVHSMVDQTLGGQLYKASGIKSKIPQSAETGVRSIEITFDDVTGAGRDYIKLTKNNTSPPTLVYRMFLSSDLSTPVIGPHSLTVTSVSIQRNTQMLVRAKTDDLVNKKGGRFLYDVAKFPALRG